MDCWLLLLLLAAVLPQSSRSDTSSSSSFDPYVLNGGLLAAVAGRDYIVVATDTRLTGPTGYDILERHHVSSRIWAATTTGNCRSMVAQQQQQQPSLTAPDGSLNIDLNSEIQKQQYTSKNTLDVPSQSITTTQEKLKHYHTTTTNNNGAAAATTTAPALLLRLVMDRVDHVPPPVWVGSVGCQADCEALKRNLRSNLRAAQYFGEISYSNENDDEGLEESTAVALSQILYRRRGFPYYSFCVVAGLSSNSAAAARVYGYDAIGSYEALAVTCAGTAKTLMQPILDRFFQTTTASSSSSGTPTAISSTTESVSSMDDQLLVRDASSTNSRRRLRPVVVHDIPPTHVDCPTPEEAVEILLAAYRAVAEREIGVGDHVVFYTVHRIVQEHKQQDGVVGELSNSSNEQSSVLYQSRIWTSPLKKH